MLEGARVIMEYIRKHKRCWILEWMLGAILDTMLGATHGIGYSGLLLGATTRAAIRGLQLGAAGACNLGSAIEGCNSGAVIRDYNSRAAIRGLLFGPAIRGLPFRTCY